MATTNEMRTCRTIGHAWEAINASRKPQFGYLIELRCERCATIRNDLVDRHGMLLARHYDYPFGYRDAEITDGTRDDKRMWLMKELLRTAKELAAPVVPIRRKRKNA